MNFSILVVLLALGYQTASAQLVTESFGSGANAFTMDFAMIGNPGNAADTTGSPNPAGSVAYIYSLGKYEVSRDMINKANAEGGLGITLFDMTNFGGNGVNRPATGTSWYEAAKFVNWLNSSTGYVAAYKFDASGNFQLWSSTDAGYNANNRFRNSNARYWLPSTDEWYKGAFGSPNGTWFNYPTGSNTIPTSVAGGTSANTAVYSRTSSSGPADITNAGGLSAYGTMGQGGNVLEYTETEYDGVNNSTVDFREVRGGQWGVTLPTASSGARSATSPTGEQNTIGFRVATVPEPSALSLLAIGLGGLALVRRRK
jgi:formylglycine-generating enzyme